MFDTHINYIKDKSLKRFGFIKFSCGDLKNLHAIKQIYTSYSGFPFDYCSVIWKLSKINFLGVLCYRCNIPRIHIGTYNILISDFLSMDSLELRRIKLDIYFYKIFFTITLMILSF